MLLDSSPLKIPPAPTAPPLSPLATNILESENKGHASTYASVTVTHSKTSNKEDTVQKKEDQIRVGQYIMDADGFLTKFKKCNAVIGKRNSSANSLHAIRRTSDIYIGRLDKSSINPDALVNFIEKEAGVSVIKCIDLKCQIPRCASFKVTVHSDDLNKVLSEDLWEFGTECRLFVNRNRFNY